ncbi:hypothetical protein PVAND_004850 [Polypedilum vanderplanki]|uniref:Cytochrome P450 n=1 Tax=Polypedilum vanderplanki TaxID=319348 RepID=A0A9J6BY58_POLVA|nr:hypothetical protein PVAND_004850 [Polypedilum vanderplanki]
MQGVGTKCHSYDLFRDIYNEFKEKDVIAGLYNFDQLVYMIIDLELVKNILVRDFNYFFNRKMYVNEEGEPLTGHLFSLRARRKFNFFKERGIPYVEPSFPLGNFQGVGSKYHSFDVFRDIYDKLKGKDVIAGVYSFTQPVYLIMDVELVKNVLIRDFNTFINRGGFVNEKDEPLTGHLFSLKDDKWRFLRNKLSPAFTSGKMKAMYYTISDKGKDYVDLVDNVLKEGKAINIKEITNCYTVDVVASVAFGMESNTMKGEHPELLNIFKELFGPDGTSFLKFFFLNAFPNFSKTIKLRVFSKDISDFFINVISRNIENREKTNDNRQDFLNMLIQLKNKGSIDGEFSTENRKITLNDALAQAFVFYFASADASSTTISFALAELAHHSEIQERLRTEILEKTKGKENDEISYETLQEMTYLGQVVNETLRMYTMGSILLRQANEDYKIPNSKHVIPKGADVFVPMIGLHFDDRYWKNPYKFDPERFTPEEIAKRPNHVYLPFGDGMRNCIGMRYALLTVKFALATILRNFKVTPNPKMKYPIKFNPKNPLMEPDGGFWLNIERI